MLESKYMVKPCSIGDPRVFIGANFGKVLYGDSSYSWTMISNFYVKETINNTKKGLKEDGLEYNKKLSGVNYFLENPFSSVKYWSELDTYMEFN